jgi:hypothetical protein
MQGNHIYFLIISSIEFSAILIVPQPVSLYNQIKNWLISIAVLHYIEINTYKR